MQDFINWGIVAPGRIAHKFARDLQLVKGAKLYAIASRSFDRANEFARLYNAPHAFGSYEEMVACPGLDAVYVASPHSEHCPHSLLFLENKIPVLCEKPIAINARQTRLMIETARSNGTFFMEALWTRFIPLFEKMLEVLDEGIIGELKTVRADFGFHCTFPPEHRVFNLTLGGGALLDVGIYPVFLANCLFGKPESIKATAVFGQTGADESCAILLQYPGNKLAILDASIVVKTETEAHLYGEKGIIKLPGRFIHPQEMTVNLVDGKEIRFELAYKGGGFVHEIEEVMYCLRAGKTESEKMPLDFSLQLMETLDSVRKEAGINYPGLDA
jgi:predicted dehydrogenase